MRQSSPPLDTWGQLTAKVARVEAALVAVSLVALLLAGVIAWRAYAGVNIHYIPPGGPGLSPPGIIPDAYATDYASLWLLKRYTFTPSTIKITHAAILHTLHPSLTVGFKVQAEREALAVKEKQQSSQVAVVLASVAQRTADSVTVALDATLTKWVGGQQVSEEPLRAELTLVPWLSQGSPAGLAVSHVKINPSVTTAERSS
jgi:hypothetical protein